MHPKSQQNHTDKEDGSALDQCAVHALSMPGNLWCIHTEPKCPSHEEKHSGHWWNPMIEEATLSRSKNHRPTPGARACSCRSPGENDRHWKKSPKFFFLRVIKNLPNWVHVSISHIVSFLSSKRKKKKKTVFPSRTTSPNMFLCNLDTVMSIADFFHREKTLDFDFSLNFHFLSFKKLDKFPNPNLYNNTQPHSIMYTPSVS